MKQELIDNALRNLSISELNEMQRYVLGVYEESEDVILLSPTGSGKTLAFLLPLLSFLDPAKESVQALVLAPSRELAMQIEDVFKGMQTGLRVGSCYGGHSMYYEERMLENPPALLVGTPGRIKDHIERKSLKIDSIRTLVLDEFDKSLEFGFEDEMSFIIASLERSLKKKVLLSATDMPELPEFTDLNHPSVLNFLSERDTLNGLKFYKVLSPVKDKLEVLLRLVCHIGNEPTLVFCNYRDSVERVCNFLQTNGVVCKMFHGGMEQQDREKSLCSFRNGSCYILVSTDLAARGLDIPEVKNVVHYHLPLNEEAYTHRNGRTARMFAEGSSFMILNSEETLPEYVDQNCDAMELPENQTLPGLPDWVTLYVGKGKQDKLSKGDIAGFLMKKGRLNKAELGKIELKEHFAFAAVKRDRANNLLQLVANEKIKGIKTIFELAK